MRSLWLSLLAACVLTQTGCTFKGLGEALANMPKPSIELAEAATEFRTAKERWPKDYAELTTFLKQSDALAPKLAKLEQVEFDRVSFSEDDRSRLHIAAAGMINYTNISASGNATRINHNFSFNSEVYTKTSE